MYGCSQLTGIIPTRIGLLLSLETLNLANNQFTGNLNLLSCVLPACTYMQPVAVLTASGCPFTAGTRIVQDGTLRHYSSPVQHTCLEVKVCCPWQLA
jgi:hypothetical protein